MSRALLGWEGRVLLLTLLLFGVRRLLRRRSRELLMPLWWLYLLRLLCPLSAPLLPPRPVSAFTGAPVLLPAAWSPAAGTAGSSPWSVEALILWCWAAGAAAMVLRMVLRRLRLRRILRFALREAPGVWCCQGLPAPFAAGVLRGRIYLPCRLPEEVRRQALRHEEMHLRCRDPLLLLAAELAAALHWWNPLVPLAAAALREDVEMRCDERILRDSCAPSRRAYFQAMLHFGAPAGPGPSFAASQAERRVIHISGLRPLPSWTAWGIAAALALCVLPWFVTLRPAASEVPRSFDSEADFARAVIDAAAREDARTLAALTRYPLSLRREGERLLVRSPSAFLELYPRIMGAETRRDLLAADPEDLLENWGGVMIGQGGVWFERTAGGRYGIIAINEMK